MKIPFFAAALLAVAMHASAQTTAKPEDTEVYKPVPPVVTPGATVGAAPSDALMLFDGKNLSEWVMSEDRNQPAKWKVADGAFTVDKATGSIETKRSFGNYQLHLEWRVPKDISGSGQLRGNSGLFLASLGKNDVGYELQILDSYKNDTYVNGMAGSIYKQRIPLVNPARPPGEWQTYDVIWTAPTFDAKGLVQTPARVTAFFNGILVQNAVALAGPTRYIGPPQYQAHGPASPIMLQAHADKSEPLSFRNIWIREIKE